MELLPASQPVLSWSGHKDISWKVFSTFNSLDFLGTRLFPIGFFIYALSSFVPLLWNNMSHNMSGCMGHWATWSSARFSGWLPRIGGFELKWSLRSFPPQAILWFYDSVITLLQSGQLHNKPNKSLTNICGTILLVVYFSSKWTPTSFIAWVLQYSSVSMQGEDCWYTCSLNLKIHWIQVYG